MGRTAFSVIAYGPKTLISDQGTVRAGCTDEANSWEAFAEEGDLLARFGSLRRAVFSRLIASGNVDESSKQRSM